MLTTETTTTLLVCSDNGIRGAHHSWSRLFVFVFIFVFLLYSVFCICFDHWDHHQSSSLLTFIWRDKEKQTTHDQFHNWHFAVFVFVFVSVIAKRDRNSLISPLHGTVVRKLRTTVVQLFRFDLTWPGSVLKIVRYQVNQIIGYYPIFRVYPIYPAYTIYRVCPKYLVFP